MTRLTFDVRSSLPRRFPRPRPGASLGRLPALWSGARWSHPWAGSAFLGLLTLFAVIWFRTAWISDDAMITLRSVLNLLAGGGPNFNWGDRVDAFTDPAWFLLIAAIATTGLNVFWATLALSFVLCAAALAVVWRYCASSMLGGALGIGALLLSKSFVDFSSSGLENPLGAFLVVSTFAAAAEVLRGGRSSGAIWYFFIASGVLFLTRVDLLVVVLPLAALLMHRLRRAPRRLLPAVGAGAALPVAWTAFSLVYYGFAVPNTAYSKLGSGIGKGALMLQGVKYLLDSLTRDPITLVLIAAAVVASVAVGSATHRAFATGLALYLAYVVWIGGDFMTGRFLMVPAVGASALLASLPLTRARLVGAAILLGVLGAVGLPNTLLSNGAFTATTVASSGIADERGFWFQRNGLLADNATGYDYGTWTRPQQQTVGQICGGLGAAGLSGGPGLHMIDTCGLADALLARLPAASTPNWRIGHFVRALPVGYRASVENDDNRIPDPALHRYYAALRLVTRGDDLLAPARIAAIWELNTGQLRPGTSYAVDPNLSD